MLTTKDIMESGWAADLPYSDVVLHCQQRNIPVPTQAEYKSHCAVADDNLQDWFEGNCDDNDLVEADFYSDRNSDLYNYRADI